MNRFRIAALAVALALTGLLPALAPQPAQGQADDALTLNYDELIFSTVQIYTCDSLLVSNGPANLSTFQSASGDCKGGSGTVIRPDGVILTNSHVALDTDQRNPIWLLVLQTVDDRALPQEAFIARAVLYSPRGPRQSFGDQNPYLDLAVIAPVYTLDGTPIQPGDLTMRPLPMAEAETVSLGDQLVNLGYPGIGGDLITMTQGAVSGFEPDEMVPQLGLTAWIKTDATLGGGISGGTTVNVEGFLIGVPTEVGSTDQREGLGTVGIINHIRPIPEGYNLMVDMGLGDGIPEAPSATSADDVTVTGTIVSADTGQPIGGAWFIVLKPEVPVSDFLGGNQEAVYSFATSSANGQFQLTNPIVRGQGYGVLVIARGFLNMSEDNKVLAAADAPAVVTLPPIQMAVQR